MRENDLGHADHRDHGRLTGRRSSSKAFRRELTRSRKPSLRASAKLAGPLRGRPDIHDPATDAERHRAAFDERFRLIRRCWTEEMITRSKPGGFPPRRHALDVEATRQSPLVRSQRARSAATSCARSASSPSSCENRARPAALPPVRLLRTRETRSSPPPTGRRPSPGGTRPLSPSPTDPPFRPASPRPDARRSVRS